MRNEASERDEHPGPPAQGCRHVLWRNPEDLIRRQEAEVDTGIAKASTRVYRAYLMKEKLRMPS